MSGNSDVLPVIDDRTRQLIADLVETGVQNALAAARNIPAGEEGGAAQQEPLPDSGASPAPEFAEIHTGAGGAPEVPGRGSGGLRGAPGPPFEAEGRAGDDEEEADDEDDGVEDTDGSDSAGGPQAFTAGWYEARRGRHIPPRFDVPPRFDPNYPVSFPAESVAHFLTFGSGNASAGREGEAGALYSSAAYTTRVSNSLVDPGRRMESLEARLVGSPEFAEELRAVHWTLSDAQLSTFGVYELTASRYELLCGLQGASGVADPALLGTFLDAPAAYSSAGRQTFRKQQQQAIRSAAQVTGRRQGRPAASSPPSSTPAAGRGGGGGATQPAAGGRGRSRNRRGDRGGRRTPAAGAGNK